jgi:hypothetical protein
MVQNKSLETSSSDRAVSITNNNATNNRCRAVWIGTTQSLDFSVDESTWVTFAGCTAGTIIPVAATGARKTAGSAAPTAGDVVFLY